MLKQKKTININYGLESNKINQDLVYQIGFAIEDIKEELETTDIDYTLIEKGIINYINGNYNNQIHSFIKQYRHFFIAFQGLYQNIITNMRKYETHQKTKY